MKIHFNFFLAIAFLLSSTVAKSQLEKSNWHFGLTSKGLYFSPTGIVTVTNFSYTPHGGEGCSVLSDPATGNLEFYTDGSNVIDAGHAIMPNGSGLINLPVTEGTGKIMADPTNCDRYYVFHNTGEFENSSATHKLYYSVVDMNLPGNGTIANPKGDVVTSLKNILVASNVAEGVELVPVTNSHDFWLLVPSNSPSSVSVYKITSGGVLFINSYLLMSTLSDIRPITYCKANNKIAIASMNDLNNTLLLDFNPITGAITNQSAIPGLPAGTNGNYYGIYSLAWSEDGTKLYISKYREGITGGKLYQHDLTTSITQLVYDVNPFSISYGARGLKMGPDGKIYFLYMDTSGAVINIGAVNNPNNAAVACNFNPTQINMGSDLLNTNKFPDFLYSNNTILTNIDITVTLNRSCTSSETSFININQPLTDIDGDLLSYQLLSNTFSDASAAFTDQSTIRYNTSVSLSFIDTLTIRYCDDYCDSKCNTLKMILNVNPSETPISTLIPNVFTPNGDGENEYFEINYGLNDCAQFRAIMIFNSWGQKMFESKDPGFMWDGKVKGNNSPEGVYFGIIESGEAESIKKEAIHISLLR